jgi:hypothetical protein
VIVLDNPDPSSSRRSIELKYSLKFGRRDTPKKEEEGVEDFSIANAQAARQRHGFRFGR